MKRNSQKIIQACSSFGIIDSVSVGIRTVVHIDLAEKNSHFCIHLLKKTLDSLIVCSGCLKQTAGKKHSEKKRGQGTQWLRVPPGLPLNMHSQIFLIFF